MRRLGQLLLDWGGFALKHPMAFLLTFALGGGFTFAYSYIPLHTVKLQKIGRLEQAVLTQEDRIAALDYEVEGLQTAAEGGLDAAAVATLRAERDAAGEDNDKLRAEVDRAKQRTKRLERERSEWRRRVGALERQLEAATTELAERSTPAPPSHGLPPEPEAPDAGAAAAVTTAAGVVVAPASGGGPPSAPAP